MKSAIIKKVWIAVTKEKRHKHKIGVSVKTFKNLEDAKKSYPEENHEYLQIEIPGE